MQQYIYDDRLVSAYHEAGHIVLGWYCDLPISRAVVEDNCASVHLSWSYTWTSMFREVNQSTVRRNIMFCLGGRFASTLFGLDDAEEVWHSDVYIPKFLAQRFSLDLEQVAAETRSVVLLNKPSIKMLAQALYEKHTLDGYDLALARLNLLARGELRLFRN